MGRNHLPFGQRRPKKNPCSSAPAVPDGVVMTFQATEARTHLRFTGKIKWDPVTDDQDGFPVKIDRYEVRYCACEEDGTPVESEDAKTRFHVRHKAPPSHVGVTDAKEQGGIATYTTAREHGFQPDDTIEVTSCEPLEYNGTFAVIAVPDATSLTADIGTTGIDDLTEKGRMDDATDHHHVITGELPRPKKWYWKASVRARNTENCWSPWSPWTDPSLPWDGADPMPPYPENVDLSFEVDEKAKKDRLFAVTTWDEVTDWDVPGGDIESDMDRYIVQLQRSTDGVTKTGTTRTKTKNAKGDETDDDDVVKAVWEAIRSRNHYRTRVRSVDRFNRRGEWSPWTLWLQPGEDPNLVLVPTSVSLDVDQHKFHVYWDAPKQEGENFPDPCVDHFEVLVSTSSDPENTDAVVTYHDGDYRCEDRVVKAEHITFRASKPGNTLYYAHVRTVTDDDGTSAWVTTSARKGTPTTPAPPTIEFDHHGTRHARFRAVVTPSTVSATDNDLAHYVIRLVHSATGGSNPPSGTKREYRRIDADLTGDDLTVVFKNIPKKHYVWARERVVDTEGRKSEWSDWRGPLRAISSSAAMLDTPAAPSNVEVTTKLRRVIVKWDEPEYDDTTDQYRVQVFQGGVLKDTVYTRARHYRYMVPEEDKGKVHKARVVALDEMGNASDESESAEVAEPGEEYPGTGTPGPGSIGDLSQFTLSVRPVVIWEGASLPTLPDASNWPIGSLLVWVVDGKLYRNVDNVWTKAVPASDLTGAIDGDDVTANTVFANGIYSGFVSTGALVADDILGTDLFGVNIVGGAFSTQFPVVQPSEPGDRRTKGTARTEYIEISGGDASNIKFYSPEGSGTIGADNGGVKIGGSSSAKLGFWGNQPGSRPDAPTVPTSNIGTIESAISDTTHQYRDGTARKKVNKLLGNVGEAQDAISDLQTTLDQLITRLSNMGLLG